MHINIIEYTPNIDEPIKGVTPVNLEITVSKVYIFMRYVNW